MLKNTNNTNNNVKKITNVTQINYILTWSAVARWYNKHSQTSHVCQRVTRVTDVDEGYVARWPAGHISRRLRGTVAGGSNGRWVFQRILNGSLRERACVFKFGNMRDG